MSSVAASPLTLLHVILHMYVNHSWSLIWNISVSVVKMSCRNLNYTKSVFGRKKIFDVFFHVYFVFLAPGNKLIFIFTQDVTVSAQNLWLLIITVMHKICIFVSLDLQGHRTFLPGVLLFNFALFQNLILNHDVHHEGKTLKWKIRWEFKNFVEQHL